MFLAMNRNKRGMTLDPAAPQGREIVKKLVATADVVVANLPPRCCARWGSTSTACARPSPTSS